jgi:hypothetical protein
VPFRPTKSKTALQKATVQDIKQKLVKNHQKIKQIRTKQKLKSKETNGNSKTR